MPVPNAVVFPTAGRAVAKANVVGGVALVDRTAIYPVGGVEAAAVNVPEIVEVVCADEVAVAANEVGAVQGGGGVKVYVFPEPGTSVVGGVKLIKLELTEPLVVVVHDVVLVLQKKSVLALPLNPTEQVPVEVTEPNSDEVKP